MRIDAAPDFGELVSQRRHEMGLTQEQLAERAGMSVRGISDLERGARRSPHLHTVSRLLDALEVQPAARSAFKLAAHKHGRASRREPDRPASGLPTPPTPFIGRARELASALKLLRRPEVRLLTFTGAGGSGKTRLAIQVADGLIPAFPDGVVFVPLASVTDPNVVTSAAAKALGVRDAADRPLAEALTDRDVLLVFDNFEQVLPAAALISSFLTHAPRIKLLITSRAPLGIAGERRFPVLPFPLPDPDRLPEFTELAHFDAIKFFAERASAVSPDFELTPSSAVTVARIAERLDGLPLAIELAAARSKVLSPAAILSRLDHRLALLTDGATDAPDRHRTLRDAISWSYDLLGRDAQRLFRLLSLFAGGFTLETSAHMWAGRAEPADELDMLDRIASLVDRSLVMTKDSGTGEPRFSMLPTLREFGVERLEIHQEAAVVHRAHASEFARLTADAEPMLTGPGQLVWFNRLEEEHDNIRQALAWSLVQDPTLALAMAGNLIRFWDHNSHLREGRRSLAAALATEEGQTTPLRGKLLWGQGTLRLAEGDYAQGGIDLEESFIAAKAVGDLYHAGFALNSLGSVAFHAGELEKARDLHEEGLVLLRHVGDREGIAALLGNLSYGAMLRYDFEGATRYGEESLAIYRDLQSDHGMAGMLAESGRLMLLQGRIEDAASRLREGLFLGERIGNKMNMAVCAQGLAAVATAQGRWQEAAHVFGAVEALSVAGNFMVPPFHQEMGERHISMLRSAMGNDVCLDALDHGRSLSLSGAVAELVDR